MGKRRKRKAIPAALHSEISEYASLLRVLRATDTLDITTQLTRLDSPNETIQATHEEPGQYEPTTPARVETPIDEDTSRSSPGVDCVHPGRSWKNWTRWPLVPEDVHLPEWGFEDEVYSLAKQVLLSDVSYRDANSDDSNVLIEDQAEVLLPSSSLRALADVSSTHLERILSALASYSFSADESTHGRSHPIGWESVLNVLGTAGLVDSTTIRNVNSRLMAIYGSQTDIIDSSDGIGSLEPSTMLGLHDLDIAEIIDDEKSGNCHTGLYKKPSRKPPMTPVQPRAGTSSSEGEE